MPRIDLKRIYTHKWPSKCGFKEARQIMTSLIGNDVRAELLWDPLSWVVWSRWVSEGSRCPYCDFPILDLFDWRQMETEHIIPSKSFHPLNLTVACQRCNKLKLNWNPVTGQGYRRTDEISEPQDEEMRKQLLDRTKQYMNHKYRESYCNENIYNQIVNSSAFILPL